MKAVRLLKWSGSVLSPRIRPESFQRIPQCRARLQPRIPCRTQATASAIVDDIEEDVQQPEERWNVIPEEVLVKLPSPPVSASKTSARLAALHARLGLPSRLPLESLARTLVDASADRNVKFNNSSFSVLGSDLLQYYTSEYIICQFPRLPLAVVFAAMNAYCGPKALATITREWGVQPAAAPGGEIDPGLLQFRHVLPGEKNPLPKEDVISTMNKGPETNYQRHSLSSRTVHDNAFGEKRKDAQGRLLDRSQGVTTESAAAEFVRAVVGAIYLHAGRSATKSFYKNHFMSRQLNLAALFSFRYPTRDLSKLCAREGFEPPVARILSETGRTSRHPVFIVGVFSGREKLGEGAGSSLDEARTRAAVAALKGWYLYSPLDWQLPSDAEESNAKPWSSQFVDVGDIVV